MKTGYLKLIIFEVICIILLLLNSFVWNILNTYITIIILFLLVIIFRKKYGFEKEHYRYTKDILIEIIIFLLSFFILFYLFGLIIGFAKNSNYYNINGLTNFIIPLIFTIILKEFLRYGFIKKSIGNKLAIFMTLTLFVLFDITNSIYFGKFNTTYQIFLFISLKLLPAITENILCCYTSYKVGYKPCVLYLLIINLYNYLMPIIVNPTEYLTSIIYLLLPMFLMYRIYSFFKQDIDKDIEIRKKNSQIVLIITSIIFVTIMVYFSSGYFRYHAIAVGSGSMTPNINKGDVVVIKKIKDNNYESLKEGQVIA